MPAVDLTVQNRVRSDAELAFSVMRLLATARLLWPCGGALSAERLAVIAVAPLGDVRRAIAMLCAEGVAVHEAGGADVRLSDHAARELLRGRGAPAADPAATLSAPAG